ncbi:hypothetical protein P153DRAFT_361087 [Dothidotthia symphoricarpi CBS 119687]|uniref:Uncharacterized protein n=1 Tax=Dothidotthia symphoricarpi CBS 119687 TaxID=1392245 RepID=A0A6A5ZZN9_9PLEO|nr:uncharacterized protein P153DRAFT_361087 [Dothidotthia symphoricarpi CBS 119687]KAF2124364.1 hypothetical protein P153DRAFT_361087 [Dothidotthia symphoricarpi CBS 119687]
MQLTTLTLTLLIASTQAWKFTAACPRSFSYGGIQNRGCTQIGDSTCGNGDRIVWNNEGSKKCTFRAYSGYPCRADQNTGYSQKNWDTKLIEGRYWGVTGC